MQQQPHRSAFCKTHKRSSQSPQPPHLHPDAHWSIAGLRALQRVGVLKAARRQRHGGLRGGRCGGQRSGGAGAEVLHLQWLGPAVLSAIELHTA